MADEVGTLIAEAETMGLFKPHGAFEVHCVHCHARLDGRGDCATCGLIGRSSAEVVQRGKTDPAGTAALVRTAIDKRKRYKPVGREKTAER
jgi:hypothetical protein